MRPRKIPPVLASTRGSQRDPKGLRGTPWVFPPDSFYGMYSLKSRWTFRENYFPSSFGVSVSSTDLPTLR